MKANTYHKKAMDIAVKAVAAKVMGDLETAKKLFLESLPWERRAADFFKDTNIQPTRSVLYRSAASMAMNCDQFDEAKRLIKTGLENNPPPEIKRELLDLRKQVRGKEKEEIEEGL
jgi:hypothetical protein